MANITTGYYSQFTDNNDQKITSAEVGLESKLYVTVTDKELDIEKLKSQMQTKLDKLNVHFEFKSQYVTKKGHSGLFFVAPDIF